MTFFTAETVPESEVMVLDENVTLERPPTLLLTVDSFRILPAEGADAKKDGKVVTKTRPAVLSAVLTIPVLTGVMMTLDYGIKLLLYTMKDIIHENLEHSVYRGRMSRQLSDVILCIALIHEAWLNRSVCQPMFDSIGKNPFSAKTMPGSEADRRLARYLPGVQRLMLWFVAYQLKDTHDTIYWGDGMEFIFHHFCAISGIWLCWHPSPPLQGFGHIYCVFYAGLLEASTIFLCLCVIFTEDGGVPGLADTYPTVFLVFQGLFVLAFFIVRMIVFPYCSIWCMKDSFCLVWNNKPFAKGRRVAVTVISACCAGLLYLQFFWWYEICVKVKTEILGM